MPEWRQIPLGEFVRLQRGHDLTSDERRAGRVPVMGSGGLNGWHDTAKARGPGVVVGRSGVGSMGAVHYCVEDFWPHNTTLYVSDFLGNNPLFAYFLLTTLNFRRYDSGSAQASLNRNFLYHIPVLRPPLDQQHAIAHVLGTLDDKIELNRKMSQALEEMARALFKSWFVDFEPVHAKAAGKKPYGMDEATAALFPDSFENSELGRIPKGWAVAPFSSVVDVNPSLRLQKGQLAPYVEMKQLSTGEAIIAAEPVLREFSSGSRFRQGDTLLARITPCLENGKTALVNFLNDSSVGWGSTEFIVLGPRLGTSAYVYCAARSERLRNHAIAAMTGSSGRQRVPVSAFDSLPWAVAPGDLMDRFEAAAGPMFRQCGQRANESRTLGELRDSLLPNLLSGELRVGDLEKKVGAVA